MEMWALATFTLVLGLIDDLRLRKVRNSLLLALLPILLGGSFYFRGFEGSMIGVSALLAALLLSVPLFIFGALGGGDVKLFALFALCLDPISAAWILAYSIIWGALFGLTRSALQKNLMQLVRNTHRLANSRHRVQAQELHKIPYTFALLLGWFTQLTLWHAGGYL